MSDTEPADPGPEGASRADVRALIDRVVRDAAPRLGKTAVARIAQPLTDAVVALRSVATAQADVLTRPADLENDDVDRLLDEVVSERELRDALARRGVFLVPFGVGSVVVDMFGLAHAPAGTWIEARDGDLGIVYRETHDGEGEPGHTVYGVRWASGAEGDFPSAWPATVRGLPGGAA